MALFTGQELNLPNAALFLPGNMNNGGSSD
jgi:hypothetical protein